MKVTVAKKELGGLFKAGDHDVNITECGLEMSKEQPKWSDRTPQLKVVMKNATGMITSWLNLRGYKNSADTNGIAPKGHEFRSYSADSEKFLVNKATGKRVVDDERTQKLLSNVGNLAFAAGIQDEEIDTDNLPDALLGASLTVRVRESANGKPEAYFFLQTAGESVSA